MALIAVLAGSLALGGCSSKPNRNPFAGTASPMYKGTGPIPKGGGRYHIGKPYDVAGRKYYPRADASYDKVGIASWYGPSFHRRMTSNGEWFDMNYLSAAHPTLPLPSYVRVTNLENKRTIVVRVNDRGPFVADRVIDLSKRSADALGFRGRGTAKVRVTYLGPAPLDDRGSHLAAMNRGMDTKVMVASDEKPRKVVVAKVDSKPQPTPEPKLAPAVYASDGYFVQVAAYSDPANAGRAKSNLSSLGPISITTVQADLGTFYRLRVGPLGSEEEASSTLQQIRAAGYTDARLVVAQN